MKPLEMRTLSTSEIDALLESKDNPDAWRTIKDHKNQREALSFSVFLIA